MKIQEEDFVIEKCIVYINAKDPMSRVNSVIRDGKKRMAVTLPHLKCLNEYPDKYLPYNERDLHIKEEETEDKKNQLSLRERKAYDMFYSGSSVREIASEFRTSSNNIRKMIHTARVKLGERIQEVNTYGHIKRKTPDDLQGVHKEMYELYKSGYTRRQIAEKINKTYDSVRSALQRIRCAVGDKDKFKY